MSNDQMQQSIINEEYKLWKKNSAFLYDLILSSGLEWPSLTVQWLPDKRIVRDPNDIDYSIQRVLIATHTNDSEQDYIMIAEVKLPTIDPKKLSEKYKTSSDVYGGFGGAAGKFDIIQKIPHNGEANRARYMPQNSNIIATKTKHGSINIFDRRKYPLKPLKGAQCNPTLILRGHQKEGYGLEWNRHKEGYLVSSAEDGMICIYDIQQMNNNNNTLDPVLTLKKHLNRVDDISWHQCGSNGDIFGSVGDDKCIILWDLRCKNKPIAMKKDAHKSEINCIDFSPFNENLFVTGGGDNHVALWDKRNMNKKLHQMEGHTDDVYQVIWSPHSEVHLASASADRRVFIWDLSLIGQEQNGDDAEDGPPELMFVHGGHTDKVTDFSWNCNDPWVMASVAENNVVQCWQMTEELLIFEDSTQHVQLE